MRKGHGPLALVVEPVSMVKANMNVLYESRDFTRQNMQIRGKL